MTYLQCHFCNSTIDADFYLLQVNCSFINLPKFKYYACIHWFSQQQFKLIGGHFYITLISYRSVSCIQNNAWCSYIIGLDKLGRLVNFCFRLLHLSLTRITSFRQSLSGFTFLTALLFSQILNFVAILFWLEIRRCQCWRQCCHFFACCCQFAPILVTNFLWLPSSHLVAVATSLTVNFAQKLGLPSIISTIKIFNKWPDQWDLFFSGSVVLISDDA